MTLPTARSDDHRFRGNEHIRLRADFARVYARRCSAADAGLVVYVAENGLKRSRLGLSVSKKVGNAVQRNRVSRRIREAFRTSKSDLPIGLDMVCVARPGIEETGYDVSRALRALVARAAVRLRRLATR